MIFLKRLQIKKNQINKRFLTNKKTCLNTKKRQKKHGESL